MSVCWLVSRKHLFRPIKHLQDVCCPIRDWSDGRSMQGNSLVVWKPFWTRVKDTMSRAGVIISFLICQTSLFEVAMHIWTHKMGRIYTRRNSEPKTGYRSILKRTPVKNHACGMWMLMQLYPSLGPFYPTHRLGDCRHINFGTCIKAIPLTNVVQGRWRKSSGTGTSSQGPNINASFFASGASWICILGSLILVPYQRISSWNLRQEWQYPSRTAIYSTGILF